MSDRKLPIALMSLLSGSCSPIADDCFRSSYERFSEFPKKCCLANSSNEKNKKNEIEILYTVCPMSEEVEKELTVVSR